LDAAATTIAPSCSKGRPRLASRPAACSSAALAAREAPLLAERPSHAAACRPARGAIAGAAERAEATAQGLAEGVHETWGAGRGAPRVEELETLLRAPPLEDQRRLPLQKYLPRRRAPALGASPSPPATRLCGALAGGGAEAPGVAALESPARLVRHGAQRASDEHPARVLNIHLRAAPALDTPPVPHVMHKLPAVLNRLARALLRGPFGPLLVRCE